MTTIFDKFPEFISENPNISNPSVGPVTAESEEKRFSIWASTIQVEGSRVLHLGAGIGAFGAYLLANGATYYEAVSGVGHTAISSPLFSKYFYQDRYKINSGVLAYVQQPVLNIFDLVVVSNTLINTFDTYNILKNASLFGLRILVESSWPVADIETAATLSAEQHFKDFYNYNSFFGMHEVDGKPKGLLPNLFAVNKMLAACDMIVDTDIQRRAEEAFPEWYHRGCVRDKDLPWSPRFLAYASK